MIVNNAITLRAENNFSTIPNQFIIDPKISVIEIDSDQAMAMRSSIVSSSTSSPNTFRVSNTSLTTTQTLIRNASTINNRNPCN